MLSEGNLWKKLFTCKHHCEDVLLSAAGNRWVKEISEWRLCQRWSDTSHFLSLSRSLLLSLSLSGSKCHTRWISFDSVGCGWTEWAAQALWWLLHSGYSIFYFTLWKINWAIRVVFIMNGCCFAARSWFERAQPTATQENIHPSPGYSFKGGRGMMGQIAADMGREAGYTLDMSSVTQGSRIETNNHSQLEHKYTL